MLEERVAFLEGRVAVLEEVKAGIVPLSAAVSSSSQLGSSSKKRPRADTAGEREAMLRKACARYSCGEQKVKGLYVLGEAKIGGRWARSSETKERCKRCRERKCDCIVLDEDGDVADVFPKGTNACGFCLKFGQKCVWE